jgi:hypothetical protein
MKLSWGDGALIVVLLSFALWAWVWGGLWLLVTISGSALPP